MEEFESYEKLMDFVLKECSEMEYYQDLIDDEDPMELILVIHNNFDEEKVFYCCKLLKEQFGITVTHLKIDDDDLVIGEFISQTSIDTLEIQDTVILKDLPETIKIVHVFREGYDYIYSIMNYTEFGFTIKYPIKIEPGFHNSYIYWPPEFNDRSSAVKFLVKKIYNDFH